MTDTKKSLIVPTFADPRVLILSFFAVFIIYALRFPGFARTPEQFLASLGTCFLLDALLNYFLKDKCMVPMSGIVTSMGVFLLTDAEEVYFYALAAALSILSKHLLRLNGRHIFNPNNFGMVILLLVVPDYVTSSPFRWGGEIAWTLGLFALGSLIAFKANRIVASYSYYSFFVLAAGIRSLYLGVPLVNLLAPLTGPAMQLFIFFMITDPRTSPSKRGSQLLYGLVVAFTDNFFRFLEIRQAPLFALFAVTLVMGIFFYFFPERERDNPWKEKVIEVPA